MRALALVLVALAVAGCAGTTPARTPPPADVYERAVAGGEPRARIWGDDFDEARREEARRSMRAAMTRLWEERGRPAEGLDLSLLALSGGGPDGAFAAGILNGWSDRGDRPTFAVVTGISVGGLIAPLAFLGPDYDPALREIFTTASEADVARRRLAGVLFGALSLADTGPLRTRIAEIVDEGFLARVAAERARGRLLLIGTTNLDAQRPVVWDMGEIARTGDVRLFRDVMLASASIPGAFPPVPIEVEADGRRYVELHVDGGVTHSVLIGPHGAETAVPADQPFPTRWTFYLIQNNGLLPAYEPVEEALRPIVARSLSTLIRAQSDGDLERIWRAAQAIGAEYRLAFVPADFVAPPASAFDGAYMNALFAASRAAASDGIEWLTEPPNRIARRDLQRRAAAAAGRAR